MPNQEQNNSNQEGNNPNSKTTVVDSPKSGYVTQEKKKKKYFRFWTKSKTSTKVQIILAMLQFLTPLAFIYIGKQQISRTDSSLHLARSSFDSLTAFNRKSLANTQHALRNSDSSLKISSQNLKTISNNADAELRAYLSIKDIQSEPLKVGEKTKAYIHYINTGKTPAKNILSFTGNKISKGEIYQADFNHAERNMRREQPLSPDNAATHFSFSQIITKNDSIAIMNGTKHWYIIGEFIYLDVFKQKHFTRFAVFYSPAIKAFADYKKFNESN